MVEDFEALRTVLGSNTKVQELLFLEAGLKKVLRCGVYSDGVEVVRALYLKRGFVVVESPFKIVLLEEGYAEGGLRVQRDDDRFGMVFLYVSSDELSAHLALYYELVRDHMRLGELLGYPECCRSYFASNFSSDRTDLSLVSGYVPLLDISLRSSDCSLLSHFPCSFDCAASCSVALRYLEILGRVWPLRVCVLREKLGF